MEYKRLPVVLEDSGLYCGRILELNDLFGALIDAGLPEDVTVDKRVFRQLLLLVTSSQIQRDGVGVYVDLIRCRIRMSAD